MSLGRLSAGSVAQSPTFDPQHQIETVACNPGIQECVCVWGGKQEDQKTPSAE